MRSRFKCRPSGWRPRRLGLGLPSGLWPSCGSFSISLSSTASGSSSSAWAAAFQSVSNKVQLLFRELFAFAVALRLQQFAQQTPVLVLFGTLVPQLLA